ncbi:MAG: hypothetical protein QGD93_11445 [Actinomycetota bacterium]|nr:hypothetical protein [Actinomycetota bacterium]
MLLSEAIKLVEAELRSAQQRYGCIHSTHEGYAVIKEELDEAWDWIKANNTRGARKEIVQVAAMCFRFLIDLPEDDGEDKE